MIHVENLLRNAILVFRVDTLYGGPHKYKALIPC